MFWETTTSLDEVPNRTRSFTICGALNKILVERSPCNCGLQQFSALTGDAFPLQAWQRGTDFLTFDKVQTLDFLPAKLQQNAVAKNTARTRLEAKILERYLFIAIKYNLIRSNGQEGINDNNL